VKSRRKAALDYIDAHLGNAQLGPNEIADAANVSRASLYRLLAAEGGIRTVLLRRRLDEALRLMLADNKDERSLTDIARCCGLVARASSAGRSARASACRRGSTSPSSASKTSTGMKRGSSSTASTRTPIYGGSRD
jgi:AraC-like DNA-binding protein